MVKYLTLSFIINLLLFFLYSYWVGEALRNTFIIHPSLLEPLKVQIKTVLPNHKEKELKIKSSPKVENNKKTSKRSLLSSLLPQVEREYKLTFRKIVSEAKAQVEVGGKVSILSNRKVVYAPPIKPIKVEFPPAPVEVKVTVLPDGRVLNAVLLKRSGNLKVDKAVLEFVQNLRFEPINEPVIQEIYLEFRFKF